MKQVTMAPFGLANSQGHHLKGHGTNGDEIVVNMEDLCIHKDADDLRLGQYFSEAMTGLCYIQVDTSKIYCPPKKTVVDTYCGICGCNPTVSLSEWMPHIVRWWTPTA